MIIKSDLLAVGGFKLRHQNSSKNKTIAKKNYRCKLMFSREVDFSRALKSERGEI